MSASPFVVHKFGGSSMADANCFRRVAGIVEATAAPRLALVLSACRGVTDELLGAVARAEAGDHEGCRQAAAALETRHAAIADELLDAAAREEFVQGLRADL